MTLTTGVRRTAGRLADGREILYFDDSPRASVRTAPDTRDLGPREVAGQLRRDALVGDWVAVAGHRMNRTLLPPRDECPLCPTRPGSEPTEIPDADYDVVVIENRVPSYAPVAVDDAPGDPPFEHRPALG
ncbi:MAG TPA: galactose-1-phosphate uridylyltransferase, partial [Ornithinibacter sp.]|nr:galactose-1-phosphate uridylyltransferase [Ornithinibacter sp.]